jgi:hypothetical protein
VSLHGRFPAHIKVNGKKYTLGSNATEIEAAQAVDAANVHQVNFDR